MEGHKKPNILLIADYSNFHATLAKGLRKLGYQATLISDGGTFMKCNRDIDISRHYKGKIGGVLYAANLYLSVLNKMRGYDIVSFRDPQFLNLRPSRIKWFFERIVNSNKSCFLSYITTDVPFLDMLECPSSPIHYSEWFIEGKPNRLLELENKKWISWHNKKMQDLNKIFYSNIKGAVTALYEYHCSAERIFPKDKLAYGGIPIDLDSIPPQVFDRPKRMRLLIARDKRRTLEKGNDFLECAAKNVIARHPGKAELVVLENVTRQQYLETMRSCHVLLDQIYSYTPATMALECMAAGLTAISGAESQFYDFIGEKENFPIINAPYEFEALEKCIEQVVLHPEYLQENSIRSREFVKKHNSMETVAKRFMDFWIKNG